MNKKRLLFSAAMILLLGMVLGACGEKKTGDKKGKDGKIKLLSMATGGTGGTYYPLGRDIANMIQDATGIETKAITSNGSIENMKLIKKEKVEIAFTQTDIATYASEGTMMFKNKKVGNMSGLGILYPESIQLVTLEKSGIKSVEDLKGKTVSIGEAESGTRANAEQILEIYGLKADDLKSRYLSFDDSATGIQDGTIDAAFITAGTPTGAVEGLAATEKLLIVPIDADKIDALIAKYPYYIKETIPTGTYGSDHDIETVAVPAMLVVRSELTNKLVYDMTKAIFENTNKIVHAKGKSIKAENALNGMGTDLHPGAKKYFDEKGVSSK
ncbi:TAXI family TRAP transporter solute-binding subunit [Lederbergia citrea]|uniref:TAXI family TRAP transporter solute-binding subunit n=1 Tax=Lederbergia citrea TaxID=2833581 RepID=UPI001BC9D693|nr:TAXI family TRAP transporter solute-binding subunit [Lederbergia citrea]MBS4177372.1 TAXI family TRAP transporter solute-binding subunit [Lederbergia citrea]